MSVEQMRAILCKQYHGAWKWVKRVQNMPDRQVIAIYNRMLNENKLNPTT